MLLGGSLISDFIYDLLESAGGGRDGEQLVG